MQEHLLSTDPWEIVSCQWATNQKVSERVAVCKCHHRLIAWTHLWKVLAVGEGLKSTTRNVGCLPFQGNKQRFPVKIWVKLGGEKNCKSRATTSLKGYHGENTKGSFFSLFAYHFLTYNNQHCRTAIKNNLEGNKSEVCWSAIKMNTSLSAVLLWENEPGWGSGTFRSYKQLTERSQTLHRERQSSWGEKSQNISRKRGRRGGRGQQNPALEDTSGYK